MRIVGGELKGKKIFNSLDKTTRPLKDLVRESIFNILEHSKNEYVKLKNSKILDLFSGTGSFGLECLSRGASEVLFFENYSKSLRILKKNIEILKLQSRSKIFEENAYKLLNRKQLREYKFDLIFLDPPFKDDKINTLIDDIKSLEIIDDNCVFVMHRNKKFKEKVSENLIIIREKNYGLSKIIFGKMI